MSSAARKAAEPHQRALQSDELLEATEKCNDALVNVLKQACSRNRALERKALWSQKDKEDHGSRSSLTLKSNRGVTKTVHLVPKEAEVTKNSVNKFEEERQKMAEAKEDVLLSRFCDGKDNAWRPDSFFAEACGDGDGEVPPWPIRPTELFTNPHICMRIMAKTIEEKSKRNTKKKSKKEKKGKDKKSKKSKKEKKHRKEKKGASKKKKKNSDNGKKDKQAGRKGGAKRARETSSEDGSIAPDLVEVGSDDCQQEGAPGGSPPADGRRSRSRSSSPSSAAESCSADFGAASSPT